MNLQKLLRKREAIEQEILRAQALEKRKSAILSMPEFSKIAHLPDEVLRAAFGRIYTENSA